jgi:hypothetical protein
VRILLNTYGPWVSVEAEPVILDPPHDRPFRFAVHPALSCSRTWTVTNLETGMAIARGPTPEQAVASANAALAVYTAGELAAIIRRRRAAGHASAVAPGKTG